jgi:hypothetical protein
MATPTLSAGGVHINVACFCLIPLSWAPYFMDNKKPYQALLMRKELVATLMGRDNKRWAAPILDWLRASCTRFRANALDRHHSILNVNLEATASDTRVVKMMRDSLAPFQKPVNPLITIPTLGAPTRGAPILPAGGITAGAG